MNKSTRITWDEGTRFSLHDPRKGTLPPQPTPAEFEEWLRATRVLHGAYRWTKGGVYGAQFCLNIVDYDGNGGEVYRSTGCGYDKRAFCFVKGAIAGVFKAAGYPVPVYDDHYMDRYLERIGLIVMGDTGIR